MSARGELHDVREVPAPYPWPRTISEATGHDRAACPDCTAADAGEITPDPFVVPVTFPSGVRWEPTDYRPIDQAAYRVFAGRRGPNSGETS